MERKLPQWYLAKVNAAADVFADAPERPILSRPHVEKDPNSGLGVSAQRIGKAATFQPPPSTVNAGTSQRTSAPGRDGERWDVPENGENDGTETPSVVFRRREFSVRSNVR